MLATTLPYLLGYAVQGQNWRFTGFVFGVEDGNSYIAKMLSGAFGDWLFRTPYTTFPQTGLLAFFPYILLGKLASPPGLHEQLVALFHLFRLGSGFLAILATYDFLTLFLTDIRWRRIGLVLGTLGGGLGWIFVIIGQPEWMGSLPLEFYSPESFGFLSIFGLPHLALVRALLLWGFVYYLTSKSKSRPQIRSKIAPGLLWLCLGLVQPLYVVVAWAITAAHLLVLGLWQAWRQKRKMEPDGQTWQELLQVGGVAIVISSPPVIYTWIASNRDPFFMAWTNQNLILSPHPLHYLLAYGLVGIILLINAPGFWRNRYRIGQNLTFLVAWILILPFLVYAPYNLQRRLAEGAWIALVALGLATVEVHHLDSMPHLMSAQQGSLRLGRIALFLALPSTCLLWAGSLLSASKPDLPLFRPASEIVAFEFIARSVQPGTVVLAAMQTGNALPAWAPVQVIIGHGPESPGLAEIKPRLEQIFRAETQEEDRRLFLQEFGVNYVFWGPAEQALGNWDPRAAPYLRPIFEQNGVWIFAVLESHP